MKEEKPQVEQEVEIPFDKLAPATLRQMIEEFVSRDGCDWDQQGCSLEDKVAQVMRQLEGHQVRIVFDFSSQTANFIPVID